VQPKIWSEDIKFYYFYHVKYVLILSYIYYYINA
jgi:hypothetical protein